MRRRTAVALVGVLALGGVGIAGYALRDHVGPLLPTEECTATVSGREVALSTEQAENAALITAISVQRGMPARAASIALATAYQESKLYNLEQGDRDSVGLFQQRPSQGWGSRSEILNPVYATNAFYDALQKIDGYDSMRITEAAQEVQRSGYPEAYADHEADARVLASALTGNSPHAFSCVVDDDVDAASDKLNDAGLTRRAETVCRDVEAAFGDLALGGFEPGGVTTGHMKGSTHYEGRAIDIFVRPISAANKKRGWAIAQYLVAQADRLSIQTVIFDDRLWKAGSRSEDGWTDYDPPDSPGDRRILEHRDHVHVDVFD
ncbi:hypothetical protein H5V45_06180 [Nocardioides sp. KIGAM211]|uniref:ARB-07466-like C-terminal domain-containing protein n=1 Tax=Nocardioides luti TaxID=2761101 RepID=A0A7X0REU6_9ACTN|nr:hypothetical protein [Nocardioides luti]MBB6626905.1 hypothetical protein [Nocardioides luti]